MIINKIKNFIHNYSEFKKFLNEIKIYLDSKNIAIVGSSQRILNNKSGNFIDNFDLVLRFNAAPTSKYEEFVGKNTNIIACNFLIFTDQHREELIKENKDPLFILKQKDKIIIVIVEKDFETFKTKYGLPSPLVVVSYVLSSSSTSIPLFNGSSTNVFSSTKCCSKCKLPPNELL